MTSTLALAFLNKYKVQAPNNGTHEVLSPPPNDGVPSLVKDWLNSQHEKYRVVPSEATSDQKIHIVTAIPIGCDGSAVGALRLASLQRHNFPLDWVQSTPRSLHALITDPSCKGTISSPSPDRWDDASDDDEEGSSSSGAAARVDYEAMCPLFSEYRDAYLNRRVYEDNAGPDSHSAPQFLSHETGTLNFSRINASMLENHLVFDQRFGLIAMPSEVKALWRRWRRIPALLQHLRACAEASTDRTTNMLLVCIGRVSGDVSGYTSMVDGSPLYLFPKMNDSDDISSVKGTRPLMAPTESPAHHDGLLFLVDAIEAANALARCVTRSAPTSAPSLHIHIGLVNILGPEEIDAKATADGAFTFTVAPTDEEVVGKPPPYLITVHHKFVGLPSAERPWANVPSMASEWLKKKFTY